MWMYWIQWPEPCHPRPLDGSTELRHPGPLQELLAGPLEQGDLG